MALTRKTRGALPSGSGALARGDRLRKERQSEYQDYVNGKCQRKRTVSDIRLELSQDREAEFIQRTNNKSSQNLYEPHADDSSTALPTKMLFEGRKFSKEKGIHARPQKRSEDKTQNADNDEQSHSANLNFASTISASNLKPNSTWDDEERDIMQWTRKKACSFKAQASKENVLPDFPSNVNADGTGATMGSISVPCLNPAIQFPGWNGKDHVQKMAKMKYAEDLRNQINDKKVVVKHNRVRHAAAGHHQSRGGTDKRVSDKYCDSRRRLPLGRNQEEDEISSQWHGFAAHSRTMDLDYPSYNLQPQANFRGHPGGIWIPPGYPHPTNKMEYDREAYPEMYQHPHDQYSYLPQNDMYRTPNDYPPPHGYHPPHCYHPPHNYLPPHNFPSHGYPPHHSAGNPYNMPLSYDPHGRPSRKENRHDLMDYQATDGYVSPQSPRRNERSYSPSLKRRDLSPKSYCKLKYREELDKQVKEKKERGMKEKIAKGMVHKKAEIEIYDPFGKGGCGAPVRDQHGNLVADLKQMRNINSHLGRNPPKIDTAEGKHLKITEPSPENDIPQTILTYGKRDEEDAKRAAQDKYRNCLRQQMKEKEELKLKEKEKQKMEEQKVLDQLERDRKRIQEDYQRELDLQIMKEEDSRRKNEAIKLEAETERQRVMMQKEQEAIHAEEEQRHFAERELMEKLSNTDGLLHNNGRSSSPPVPTLRHLKKGVIAKSTDPKYTSKSSSYKYQQLSNHPHLSPSTPALAETAMKHEVPFRTTSPPVPALRKKRTNAGNMKQAISRRDRNASVHSNPPDSGTLASTHVGADVHHGLPVSEISRPSQSGASSCYSSRKLQSTLDSEEILTKLSAIRMHLQDELALQNFDICSQSDHDSQLAAKSKDGVAMKTVKDLSKPNDTNLTEKAQLLELHPVAPRTGGTFAAQQEAIRRQQGLKRQTQMNGGKPNWPAISKNSEINDSTSMNSLNQASSGSKPLLPDSSAVSIGFPSESDSLSLASSCDTVSLPEAPPMSAQWERKRWPLSRVLVNINQMDGMANKNDERIKRLETILSSGMCRKVPQHSGNFQH